MTIAQASLMSLVAEAREPNMEIPIVIVNYYSAVFLRHCLEAVAAQSFLPSHILIVNNGDTEGALDFVAELYPNCRVIEQQNIGFAAGNNLALSLLTDCDWVALLNPDAYPEPDWLENLVSCLKQNPDIDVVSCQMLQVRDPEVLDGCGDCYHVSGLAWRDRHGERVAIAQEYTEVFSACCAAALFRRSALLAVGGFDESFFCYFEDVDLGFRLRLQGFSCIHTTKAIV
ncbi:MAG TPA: glycosyltransferase family 2 protein, partial [Spongiibacteraceae bacterium]|nr:glycosyltransferase family 2 protein [Spongiibacteraceae bacterium]